MFEWENRTCIRFVKRTNQRGYLLIRRNNGYCHAYIIESTTFWWTVRRSNYSAISTAYTHKNGWAGQLGHGCWQAWTWLSWTARTWLLTGLNMVELDSWDMVVDRLEHGWVGQLGRGCWQTWTWLSWTTGTWLLTGLFVHFMAW